MNKPCMMSLALGIAAVMLGLPAVLVTRKALEFFRRLYRNAMAGRLLTVIDMLWVGALLLGTFWGGFESYKQLTYIAVPVAIVLICLYVDELLMPRALGGLFLLIPAPVLAVFRWEKSPCRYVLIVLAYLLVLAGFALVMNPYVYRKTLEQLGKSPLRFRAAGIVMTLFGVILIGLAIRVFS